MLKMNLTQPLVTKFGTFEGATAEVGTYIDHSIAIRLEASWGEIIAIPTICLADYGIEPNDGYLLVSDYSENEEIYVALFHSGLIASETPDKVHTFGPFNCRALEFKMSDALVEALVAHHTK